MLKAIRRWWRYLGTKLGMKLEQAADPKVQLEQAIGEARDQHRLLTEQAANIITNRLSSGPPGPVDRGVRARDGIGPAGGPARRSGDEG